MSNQVYIPTKDGRPGMAFSVYFYGKKEGGNNHAVASEQKLCREEYNGREVFSTVLNIGSGHKYFRGAVIGRATAPAVKAAVSAMITKLLQDDLITADAAKLAQDAVLVGREAEYSKEMLAAHAISG